MSRKVLEDIQGRNAAPAISNHQSVCYFKNVIGLALISEILVPHTPIVMEMSKSSVCLCSVLQVSVDIWQAKLARMLGNAICHVHVFGYIGTILFSSAPCSLLVTRSTNWKSMPGREYTELPLSPMTSDQKSPIHKMRDLQVFANQDIKNILRNPFCLMEGQGVKLGGGDRWGVYSSSFQRNPYVVLASF